MRERARKLIRQILPKEAISRQDGRTMVFSFLLASALWFLVTINQKNHQSIFQIPLVIHNLPLNVDYSEPVPTEIEVEIEGLGADLLAQHFRFKPDTIQFYYSPEKDFILTRDYYSQIAQKTPKTSNIQLRTIFPDTLMIRYELRTQKKVKLISKAKIILGPNHQLESEQIVQPDSVNISGPQSILDTMTFWYTMEKELFVEKESQRFVVAIDTQAGISADPLAAILEVKSRPYTQKQIKVILDIVELPPLTSVNLSNQIIQINCLVPLSAYDKLKAVYKLEIPYSSLDESIPYFIPEIEEILPKFTKIVTRKPFQIDFVIEERMEG